jgi:hypothetical protein
MTPQVVLFLIRKNVIVSILTWILFVAWNESRNTQRRPCVFPGQA